jgi:tripartite-type tricarboxylate transporter receptor subunit TctC
MGRVGQRGCAAAGAAGRAAVVASRPRRVAIGIGSSSLRGRGAAFRRMLPAAGRGNRVRIRFAMLLVLAALVTAPAIRAQTPSWAPTRPVQMVVPFPPGGATDVVARLIAAPMAAALGQPVVVENRVGGGGTVGTAGVARAAPDGHTLLMGTIATHGIIPGLFAQVPYDAVADFAPVTQAASQLYVLVVHPSLPARSVAELVALARRQPGRLNYASAGNGTAGHLTAELFRDMAEIDIVHVPYRGAGPAMADVIGGQVSLTFDVLLTTADHIRDGRLRALAVTSAARSAAMPEIPTLAESGFPGTDAVGWNGLFLPARTPPAAVERLAAEARAALLRPEVRAQVERQGAEVVASEPDAFGRFVRGEIARWRDVIRRTGVKVE